MNYPNLPNSALEIKQQPQVKEITNELLKQLQNALHSNSLFTEQVELSLKGIVRILEVLLSLDFFKNANEIDSSLRNSIEWLSNAGESLKLKMKEYEHFFSDFNTSMHANEQEVTSILNANTEISEKQTQAITNINEAKSNANNQITENKTASLEAITQAKTSANNEISTNKTASLEAIKQEKQQATSEITEAKKTAFNELLETLKPKFSGLFVGAYYIHNVIFIQGGWEQKVKDLSDYTLDKSKKGE
nr:ATPase [Helicobacter pylori]